MKRGEVWACSKIIRGKRSLFVAGDVETMSELLRKHRFFTKPLRGIGHRGLQLEPVGEDFNLHEGKEGATNEGEGIGQWMEGLQRGRSPASCRLLLEMCRRALRHSGLPR